MIAKIISIILLSSVKFIFAFPVAVKYHFNFGTTLFLTSIGGIGGILFFSFFWEHLIKIYFWFIHDYLYKFPEIRNILKRLKNKFFPAKKQNGIAYRKIKRYVWIRKNGGLLGISLLTPFILSIPLGTFLAVRFFGRNMRTITFLVIALLFWSLLLSFFVHVIGIRF
jgi:hypothetical protein